MNIGEMIKTARMKKGMTQAELGKAVGVSQKAVTAWENNRRCMPINRANEIFKVLGISLTIGEI